jgi:hypothetical protein
MGFGRRGAWGGRGFGGGGRGWRHGFVATGIPGWMRFGWAGTPQVPAPDAERQVLENQTQALQAELDALKRRLDELQAGKAAE